MAAFSHIGLRGLAEVDGRFRGAYCNIHRPLDGGSKHL
jgi:hypothetical protein